jgi:hypothetical protein
VLSRCCNVCLPISKENELGYTVTIGHCCTTTRALCHRAGQIGGQDCLSVHAFCELLILVVYILKIIAIQYV